MPPARVSSGKKVAAASTPAKKPAFSKAIFKKRPMADARAGGERSRKDTATFELVAARFQKDGPNGKANALTGNVYCWAKPRALPSAEVEESEDEDDGVLI